MVQAIFWSSNNLLTEGFELKRLLRKYFLQSTGIIVVLFVVTAFAFIGIDTMQNGNTLDTQVVLDVVAVLSILLVVTSCLMFAFLKSLAKVLNDKSEKQKRVMSSASHEMKTPLTIIMANLDLLERETGQNELIDDIREESQRLNTLVTKMSKLSKLEQGEWIPDKKPLNLSKMVKTCINGFDAVAQSRGVTEVRHIQNDIVCQADEELMKQVVFVLLDNATKYCDEGGRVEVDLHQDADKITFMVKNDFQRADTAETERFFERFYRSDEARGNYEGFGIGLSIARKVVGDHGGSLKAFAQTNPNTITFRMILPV